MREILTSRQIGEQLRRYRKRRGLTQEQLAEKVDVTFQQIQQYESGTSRLNTDRLQAMACALSVPVASFFNEEDTEGTLSEDEQKLLNGFRQSSSEIRAFILYALSYSSKGSEK